MKIIFLGAPGSGKGTQAEAMSREFGIPIISTGNLIRKAIADKTPVGIEAEAIISQGRLLGDDLVVGIVRKELDTIDGGYIFDGFPRTITQAQALEAMGEEIDVVINMCVPDDIIVERSAGRRYCPKCGSTYHVLYNPPLISENDALKCRKCKSEVAIRDDDRADVVKNRLKIYHSQTQPLEEFYQKRGNLRNVMGQEKVEDTIKLTLNTIKKATGHDKTEE